MTQRRSIKDSVVRARDRLQRTGDRKGCATDLAHQAVRADDAGRPDLAADLRACAAEVRRLPGAGGRRRIAALVAAHWPASEPAMCWHREHCGATSEAPCTARRRTTRT